MHHYVQMIVDARVLVVVSVKSCGINFFGATSAFFHQNHPTTHDDCTGQQADFVGDSGRLGALNVKEHAGRVFGRVCFVPLQKFEGEQWNPVVGRHFCGKRMNSNLRLAPQWQAQEKE